MRAEKRNLLFTVNDSSRYCGFSPVPELSFLISMKNEEEDQWFCFCAFFLFQLQILSSTTKSVLHSVRFWGDESGRWLSGLGC